MRRPGRAGTQAGSGRVAATHHGGMPLLFLISGTGARYAMLTRSAAAFALARLVRLLVPFAFGLVVLLPSNVLSKVVVHQYDG